MPNKDRDDEVEELRRESIVSDALDNDNDDDDDPYVPGRDDYWF